VKELVAQNMKLGVGEEININQVMEMLLKNLKNLNQKGSGWRFEEIISCELHTIPFTPLSASSYLPLPDILARRHAIINIKNTDQKCFRYSVEAAILNKECNPERLYHYNRPELDYMFKDIQYPAMINDFETFEKNNPEYAIKVFTFITNQWGEIEIVPYAVSERILTDYSKYLRVIGMSKRW
jgi:hypothetical protein